MNPQNDSVFTDPVFAKKIVDYFSPQFNSGDVFLDPCAGSDGYCIHSNKLGRAFYNACPDPRLWAELTEGICCTSINQHIDWCFTNPPFSAKAYRKVAQHCSKISDNVVFLCRVDVSLGTYARITDFTDNNHHLKELIMCKYQDAGFAPRGFVLGVFHWQKNWKNGTTWSDWT